MHIQFARNAESAYEYGCDLRRLYPWPGVADPLWGSAIASVRVGESTTRHAHDEHETFLFLSGRGRITIGDETEVVTGGDMVYIPLEVEHEVENLSETEPLTFLTIFWGSPEAKARMLDQAAQLRQDEVTEAA